MAASVEQKEKTTGGRGLQGLSEDRVFELQEEVVALREEANVSQQGKGFVTFSEFSKAMDVHQSIGGGGGQNASEVVRAAEERDKAVAAERRLIRKWGDIVRPRSPISPRRQRQLKQQQQQSKGGSPGRQRSAGASPRRQRGDAARQNAETAAGERRRMLAGNHGIQESQMVAETLLSDLCGQMEAVRTLADVVAQVAAAAGQPASGSEEEQEEAIIGLALSRAADAARSENIAVLEAILDGTAEESDSAAFIQGGKGEERKRERDPSEGCAGGVPRHLREVSPLKLPRLSRSPSRASSVRQAARLRHFSSGKSGLLVHPAAGTSPPQIVGTRGESPLRRGSSVSRQTTRRSRSRSRSRVLASNSASVSPTSPQQRGHGRDRDRDREGRSGETQEDRSNVRERERDRKDTTPTPSRELLPPHSMPPSPREQNPTPPTLPAVAPKERENANNPHYSFSPTHPPPPIPIIQKSIETQSQTPTKIIQQPAEVPGFHQHPQPLPQPLSMPMPNPTTPIVQPQPAVLPPHSPQLSVPSPLPFSPPQRGILPIQQPQVIPAPHLNPSPLPHTPPLPATMTTMKYIAAPGPPAGGPPLAPLQAPVTPLPTQPGVPLMHPDLQPAPVAPSRGPVFNPPGRVEVHTPPTYPSPVTGSPVTPTPVTHFPPPVSPQPLPVAATLPPPAGTMVPPIGPFRPPAPPQASISVPTSPERRRLLANPNAPGIVLPLPPPAEQAALSPLFSGPAPLLSSPSQTVPIPAAAPPHQILLPPRHTVTEAIIDRQLLVNRRETIGGTDAVVSFNAPRRSTFITGTPLDARASILPVSGTVTPGIVPFALPAPRRSTQMITSAAAQLPRMHSTVHAPPIAPLLTSAVVQGPLVSFQGTPPSVPVPVLPPGPVPVLQTSAAGAGPLPFRSPSAPPIRHTIHSPPLPLSVHPAPLVSTVTTAKVPVPSPTYSAPPPRTITSEEQQDEDEDEEEEEETETETATDADRQHVKQEDRAESASSPAKRNRTKAKATKPQHHVSPKQRSNPRGWGDISECGNETHTHRSWFSHKDQQQKSKSHGRGRKEGSPSEADSRTSPFLNHQKEFLRRSSKNPDNIGLARSETLARSIVSTVRPPFGTSTGLRGGTKGTRGSWLLAGTELKAWKPDFVLSRVCATPPESRKGSPKRKAKRSKSKGAQKRALSSSPLRSSHPHTNVHVEHLREEKEESVLLPPARKPPVPSAPRASQRKRSNHLSQHSSQADRRVTSPARMVAGSEMRGGSVSCQSKEETMQQGGGRREGGRESVSLSVSVSGGDREAIAARVRASRAQPLPGYRRRSSVSVSPPEGPLPIAEAMDRDRGGSSSSSFVAQPPVPLSQTPQTITDSRSRSATASASASGGRGGGGEGKESGPGWRRQSGRAGAPGGLPHEDASAGIQEHPVPTDSLSAEGTPTFLRIPPGAGGGGHRQHSGGSQSQLSGGPLPGSSAEVRGPAVSLDSLAAAMATLQQAAALQASGSEVLSAAPRCFDLEVAKRHMMTPQRNSKQSVTPPMRPGSAPTGGAERKKSAASTVVSGSGGVGGKGSTVSRRESQSQPEATAVDLGMTALNAILQSQIEALSIVVGGSAGSGGASVQVAGGEGGRRQSSQSVFTAPLSALGGTGRNGNSISVSAPPGGSPVSGSMIVPTAGKGKGNEQEKEEEEEEGDEWEEEFEEEEEEQNTAGQSSSENFINEAADEPEEGKPRRASVLSKKKKSFPAYIPVPPSNGTDLPDSTPLALPFPPAPPVQDSVNVPAPAHQRTPGKTKKADHANRGEVPTDSSVGGLLEDAKRVQVPVTQALEAQATRQSLARSASPPCTHTKSQEAAGVILAQPQQPSLRISSHQQQPHLTHSHRFVVNPTLGLGLGGALPSSSSAVPLQTETLVLPPKVLAPASPLPVAVLPQAAPSSTVQETRAVQPGGGVSVTRADPRRSTIILPGGPRAIASVYNLPRLQQQEGTKTVTIVADGGSKVILAPATGAAPVSPFVLPAGGGGVNRVWPATPVASQRILLPPGPPSLVPTPSHPSPVRGSIVTSPLPLGFRLEAPPVVGPVQTLPVPLQPTVLQAPPPASGAYPLPPVVVSPSPTIPQPPAPFPPVAAPLLSVSTRLASLRAENAGVRQNVTGASPAPKAAGSLFAATTGARTCTIVAPPAPAAIRSPPSRGC
uniref:Uncharacterized protein n=1 Tax=Chromera velia CCMP2878 TaxID=1169474 RepID=A0A0G4HH39_9ALVE|eukprot:Cvel_27508.t1-p1 / transcript=Cvel_27508.t1 / gene=Cvel_27508 / organism=Chromera_velia_CCMP2878 / gene_product=hypothetical protein / transcript_product=hypothetical protein / location=Cvel_scaffold3444:571-14191(-) / protein_length=2174 / sequence_SO=supercontig / SO=protein_coding / is_pseudo=false